MTKNPTLVQHLKFFSYFGISELGPMQGKHVLSQTKLKLNNPCQLVKAELDEQLGN